MSALFVYKFFFMTELLVAELMVSSRKPKRRLFALRAAAGVACAYLIVFFFPLPEAIAYTGWYSCLMFLFFFALTLPLLAFVYAIPWNEVLFLAIVAYTVKHLCYSIFMLIGVTTNLSSIVNLYSSAPFAGESIDYAQIFYLLIYFCTYTFYYTVLYFVIGVRVNRRELIRLKTVQLLFVSAFALLVDIVLNSFVVYETQSNRTGGIVDNCFNILCCLLVFYVQLNLLQIKEVSHEKKVVSEMLRQAQAQYLYHKENIELINIKCHDIRHQIHGVLGQSNIERTEAEKISEAISIYDTLVHTGNEAVDILLTEKSLVCKNKQIDLTCMAECGGLSFIRDSDLYALFGNLMDNAIEAVSRIAEKQRRCIALNVHTVQSFVTVTVKNYYVGEIAFSPDGFPLTKKENSDYHGFGVKSIFLIAEKYGGSVSLRTEGGVFKVNILFPLPEQS